MDLQLGLSLSSSFPPSDDVDLNGDGEEIVGSVKKRCFDDAFDDDTPQTLPLLLWNGLPKLGMDIQHYLPRLPAEVTKVDKDDEYGVVGWPPINLWRKRICYQDRGGCTVHCVTVENGSGNGTGNPSKKRNSLFVKVKMEGVGIARKVDMRLHHSLDTLLQTLLAMFGKCQESVDAYKLSFQDREGFWHLAEDVAWANLIGSVDRLQLWKKGH